MRILQDWLCKIPQSFYSTLRAGETFLEGSRTAAEISAECSGSNALSYVTKSFYFSALAFGFSLLLMSL